MQQQSKKNNKVFMIIIIIVIIAIIAGIVLFLNKDKKDSVNNNQNNISQMENNNENEDISSNVAEGSNTTYDENVDFLFKIEDVFTISGRGTVVTGTVEKGTINLNDEVQIIESNKEILTTTVTGIELFRKTQDYATVGDNASLLLKDVSRDQVKRGQILVKKN